MRSQSVIDVYLSARDAKEKAEKEFNEKYEVPLTVAYNNLRKYNAKTVQDTVEFINSIVLPVLLESTQKVTSIQILTNYFPMNLLDIVPDSEPSIRLMAMKINKCRKFSYFQVLVHRESWINLFNDLKTILIENEDKLIYSEG
jgi:hypothetical protein